MSDLKWRLKVLLYCKQTKKMTHLHIKIVFCEIAFVNKIAKEPVSPVKLDLSMGLFYISNIEN